MLSTCHVTGNFRSTVEYYLEFEGSLEAASEESSEGSDEGGEHGHDTAVEVDGAHSDLCPGNTKLRDVAG